jgi:prevent-host-death family protein
MAMKHVSVAEAKNRLPALLREAESEPIEIRRNDEPAAVLVSIETYRRLSAKDRKRSVMAALDAMRAAGGLPAVARDRSSGRKVDIE